MPFLIPIIIGSSALAAGWWGGRATAPEPTPQPTPAATGGGNGLMMAALVIGGLYLLTRKR